MTPAGRSPLLATPQDDRTLTTAALSFLGILSQGDAIAAMRARVAALASALSIKDSELAEAGDLPPILLVETAYECDQLRAEHNWFDAVVGRLESGEIPWVLATDPHPTP